MNYKTDEIVALLKKYDREYPNLEEMYYDKDPKHEEIIDQFASEMKELGGYLKAYKCIGQYAASGLQRIVVIGVTATGFVKYFYMRDIARGRFETHRTKDPIYVMGSKDYVDFEKMKKSLDDLRQKIFDFMLERKVTV